MLAINSLPPATIEPATIRETFVVEDAPNELVMVSDVHKHRLVTLSSPILF
jgi:hypothetical protein